MKKINSGIFVVLILVAILSSAVAAFGQSDGLDAVVQNLQHHNNETLEEKIFIHVDRSFYLTGDYVRLKIYCVEAGNHRPVDLSSIAYIELLDQDQKPVLQFKVKMKNGAGQSSLFLPTTINSGNYILRAYTRWMQNFSPEFYFHQEIAIVNPFRTPEKQDAISAGRGWEAYFFPEGGWLVKGLSGKVAFKVVDATGKGMKCKGVVVNAHGENITSFESMKFGMGNFELTPNSEQYKAIITDSIGRTIISRDLPSVQEQGYVMNLVDDSTDELTIKVATTFTLPSSDGIFLLAHTRGTVSIRLRKPISNGGALFKINKKDLGEGITHFTVLSNTGTPVAERLYFKLPEHQLTITTRLEAASFPVRSRIDLNLQVNDSIGKPVNADVSISVFRLDSLQGSDAQKISTHLLLTSDLPGRIESPQFYFNGSETARKAVDNLMLTHGWRRFLWSDVMKRRPLNIEHVAEYRGHTIIGNVTDLTSQKPRGGVLTYLTVPGKAFQFKGSRSNAQGVVRFELQDFYGANKIIVQPNWEIDSLCKVEIKNPFSEKSGAIRAWPLDLTRSSKAPLLSRSMGMQMENIYFEKQRGKVILPKIDSAAFFNTPDEEYFLDQYTRFPTIEDVMREYVPGVFVKKQKKNFHFAVINKEGKYSFNNDPLILLDGVPVFNVNRMMEYDPLNVERLAVVTHRYLYGHMTFDGIVSYSTYRGDLKGFQLDPHASTLNYEGVEWEREFFAPRYDTPAQMASRLPDFRNLLLWIPNAKPGADGNFHTSFYSSDQPGKYFVSVNGLSGSGRCGNASAVFEVTPREKK